MIRLIKIMAALMVAMFAIPALAFDPPPAPAVGSIVDQANVLKPVAIQKLNAQLKQINQSTGNQIGILIVSSLNGENIRDVGYATAKVWKVGQAGVDNGVMIVWSRGDRQIGIETGKGVEGDLPDLKCNDIIRNVITPKFKADYPGHFYDGLSLGIAAINTTIGDHRAAMAEHNARDQEAQQRQQAPGAPQADTRDTSSHNSGGCDVSGVPVSQAGVGTLTVAFLFFIAVLLVFRHVQLRRIQVKRDRLQQQFDTRRRILDQLQVELDARRGTSDQLKYDPFQRRDFEPITEDDAKVLGGEPVPLKRLATADDLLWALRERSTEVRDLLTIQSSSIISFPTDGKGIRLMVEVHPQVVGLIPNSIGLRRDHCLVEIPVEVVGSSESMQPLIG